LADLKNGQNIAFTGFGSSAHIVLQIVKYLYPDSNCFVFARNKKQRELALKIGAYKVFSYEDEIPYKMHAIIDTTPAWLPVIHALGHLEAGGRLVINAIRKEDTDRDVFDKLNYSKHLWREKEIKSVANVTRDDIKKSLDIASKIPISPEVEVYDFDDVNSALSDLKNGLIKGAKVLKIS
jgi:propanol-preferring alcohol dehydrogenase